MLAKWLEILPVFMMRILAKKYCERIMITSVLFYVARPDVIFKATNSGEVVQFQDEVAEWADSNLPAGCDYLKKLEQELGELKLAPHDPKEMADVALALMLHASKNGYDLMREARSKFESIKHRKYCAPIDGLSQHIKEQP